MSHIRDSPEFRLSRSDSKDPLTTCQGVTSNGRKCRRTVISSKDALKKEAISRQLNGKIERKLEVRPEELFCWQHKDQVALAKTKIATATTTKLRGRSSIDTIVERVGLLNVNEAPTANHRETRANVLRESYTPRREKRAQEDRRQAQALPLEPSQKSAVVSAIQPPLFKKKTGTRERLLCFITGVSPDDLPEMIVRRKTGHRRTASHSEPRVSRIPTNYKSESPIRPTTAVPDTEKRHSGMIYTLRPAEARVQQRYRQSLPSDISQTSLRPTMLAHTSSSSSSSQTQSLLSWIPTSLSPETTSKLLQKLSEPLSSSEEWGYLYIYCVTSQKTVPSADIIPSLIPHRTDNSRPITEVLRSAGVPPNRVRKDGHTPAASTITLKIGRAINVSRRLTQQCAQNLTLVRYYPYSPSSPNAPPPKKAPNIHRLERLVHIELGDRRFKLQDPCGQCGKRHQEYFEIEATTEHLRMVDECARRWVRFSELDPSR